MDLKSNTESPQSEVLRKIDDYRNLLRLYALANSKATIQRIVVLLFLHIDQGREPERQHLSRRFAQREARNVRRHMSQELRSVATNDAIRISSARGQP